MHISVAGLQRNIENSSLEHSIYAVRWQSIAQKFTICELFDGTFCQIGHVCRPVVFLSEARVHRIVRRFIFKKRSEIIPFLIM